MPAKSPSTHTTTTSRTLHLQLSQAPGLSGQRQPVCGATTASAEHSTSRYLIQRGSVSPFERGGNGDARILSYELSSVAKSGSESSAAPLQTGAPNQDALLSLPTPALQGQVRREPPPWASAGRWPTSAPSPVEGSSCRGRGRRVLEPPHGPQRPCHRPCWRPGPPCSWGRGPGWHLPGRWLCPWPGFLCRI